MRTAPLLLSIFSIALAFPHPEPCAGVCLNVQDSNVYKHKNGTYYRFTHPIGNNKQKDKYGNTDVLGCQVASSPSLSGPWSSIGPMFGGKWPHADLPDTGMVKLWTPELHLIEDTYHFYYTVFAIYNTTKKRTWYRSQMGVATSKTLELDSFTDHGQLGVAENYPTWNRIDPNLFRGDCISSKHQESRYVQRHTAT